VFLLLVFFLVATKFAEQDRELDVQLPSASEAQPLVAKPKDIELSIDETGSYYLGAGRKMTLPEVEAALSSAAVNNPLSQTVVIRAHQGCRWNDVARAMNACYRAGLRDVKTSVAGKE
jgi:biopolymer transport protein ExbD